MSYLKNISQEVLLGESKQQVKFKSPGTIRPEAKHWQVGELRSLFRPGSDSGLILPDQAGGLLRRGTAGLPQRPGVCRLPLKALPRGPRTHSLKLGQKG